MRFSDGVVQEVDLAPVLADGQLFAAIRDDDNVFTQVRVNEESGTIEWPGGIDLDPDVLYGSFEPEVGGPLERRLVQSQRSLASRTPAAEVDTPLHYFSAAIARIWFAASSAATLYASANVG